MSSINDWLPKSFPVADCDPRFSDTRLTHTPVYGPQMSPEMRWQRVMHMLMTGGRYQSNTVFLPKWQYDKIEADWRQGK